MRLRPNLSLVGSFLPQTFNFFNPSPHCLHPLCLLEWSLPWVLWSTASLSGPNHARPHRPESTPSPFPLFSPRPHFHSVCRQRNDGKSTVKWWTDGQGEHRWGDRCRDGGVEPSWAQRKMDRKRGNTQRQFFSVSSSGTLLPEQCHQKYNPGMQDTCHCYVWELVAGSLETCAAGGVTAPSCPRTDRIILHNLQTLNLRLWGFYLILWNNNFSLPLSFIFAISVLICWPSRREFTSGKDNIRCIIYCSNKLKGHFEKASDFNVKRCWTSDMDSLMP